MKINLKQIISCLISEVNEWHYKSSFLIAKMQNPHRKCSASCSFSFWSLPKPTKHWEFRSIFWSLVCAGGCPAHPEVTAGFQRKKLSVNRNVWQWQSVFQGLPIKQTAWVSTRGPCTWCLLGKALCCSPRCAIKLVNSIRYSTFSKPSPWG